jgi:Na+-driven multidrug efflux pump
MKNVLIGGLIGLLIGIVFILFSSLYTSFAATNEVAAALTTIFLWIIFGCVVSVIMGLTIGSKK